MQSPPQPPPPRHTTPNLWPWLLLLLFVAILATCQP